MTNNSRCPNCGAPYNFESEDAHVYMCGHIRYKQPKPMNEEQIELIPGRWYRTAAERKAWCVGRLPYGLWVFDHLVHGFLRHRADGKYWQGDSNPSVDIIGPWIDKPVVDWSKERDWVKAIAMGIGLTWSRYEKVPTKLNGRTALHGGFWQPMHPSEYPTNPDGSPWTGDWKDSLIVRPEGGAK